MVESGPEVWVRQYPDRKNLGQISLAYAHSLRKALDKDYACWGLDKHTPFLSTWQNGVSSTQLPGTNAGKPLHYGKTAHPHKKLCHVSKMRVLRLLMDARQWSCAHKITLGEGSQVYQQQWPIMEQE